MYNCEDQGKTPPLELSFPHPRAVPHRKPPSSAGLFHIVLEADEIAKIVTATPDPGTDESRDLLIVLVQLVLGLRRAETANLNIQDFRFEGGRWWAVIHGKGGKWRRIPVPSALYNRFALDWSARGLSSPGAAFQRLGDARFSKRPPNIEPQTVWTATRRCTASLVGYPVRCHLLRHTAATSWLRGGATIRTVQILLGHSSLAITARYLHSTPSELAAATDSIMHTSPQLALFKPA